MLYIFIRREVGMNLFKGAWWKAEVEITERHEFFLWLGVVVALTINSFNLGVTVGKLLCR